MANDTHRPRVLILFSSSHIGGAERSLTRMATADTTAASCEIHLGTAGGDGDWSTWIRNLGYKPAIFGASTSSFFNASALVKVIHYIRSQKIDVLYISGLRLAFALRLLRPLIPGVKIVHAIRSNFNARHPIDFFFIITELFTHRLVDLYITNTKRSAQTLTNICRVPNRKVKVIYNGLEHAYASPDILPYHNRPLEVLTVANMLPGKGHIEYLSIIAKVVQHAPNVRFVFVGRDGLGGAFQKGIKDLHLEEYIRCEGFRDDVRPYLQCARILVLPTRLREGFPTSILESMLCGVPAIGYEIGGIPEMIYDGIDGYIIPLYNQELFAQRILTLLSDANLAERMGQSGRHKVKNIFSIEQCVESHIEAFYTLCKLTPPIKRMQCAA